MYMNFEWDDKKNNTNLKKHGISFSEAQNAFLDSNRIIEKDIKHSTDKENRFFCYGKTNEYIVTVRFTYRKNIIRIYGAGYWREGVKKYEKANNV
jgi:uncharacterized protein